MNVVVLYRSKSEHGTRVEQFLRDVEKQTGHELETLELDTKEGALKAELYDIVRYPAFIATAEDGKVQKIWQGEDDFPRISDVTGFANDTLPH